MSHQIPTDIDLDYPARRLLVAELLDHLGLDPAQVEADSLVIVLATDGNHRVSWSAHAKITTSRLAELARTADAKADAR